MRSQRGLDKILEEIKKNQRHCVKSHHKKDIFTILLENSLISKISFLFPNYGKRKASLGLCQQWTEHIDLRHSQELETINYIGKEAQKVMKILCAENT